MTACPACGDPDGPCELAPCGDPGCDGRDCERHDTCESPDPFDGPMCHTPARPVLPGRPTTEQVVAAMTGGTPLPDREDPGGR